EIAAEFVRLKVDVIVSNAIAVPTLMQATAVVPIVFALGLDPVGAGVVASLARPGGNVTGLSTQSTDIAGKRLELLREVLPRLRRLAITLVPGEPPSRYPITGSAGCLRARRNRPCSRRAAEQRDELAALHSITSSARSRNDSGIP